jgi:hypothetical protein
MSLRTAVALILLAASPASATDPASGERPRGVHEVRADDELIVYGDLFARWSDTRWFIETEVRLPTWMFWAANLNYEMRVVAFQIRAVLACEKEWKLSRRRYEVACRMEDIAIQAAIMEDKFKHAQAILDEMVGKLKGAAVQLQVLDNGRVSNIDLEGLPPPRNRRENQIAEALRVILSRLVVGFDMKLRKSNFLETGQWVENRSALLSMPSVSLSPASGLVVHQLNGFDGHILVQTKGEGQILGDDGSNYAVEINGVSIYDEDQGFMTERVWSLVGRRTAESFFAYGTALADYAHAGRLRMLGDTEKVDVGPTREVRFPNMKGKEDLALWTPIEAGY